MAESIINEPKGAISLSWSFNKEKNLEWPCDEKGDIVPPVFLVHVHGGPLDVEITLTLLQAYGIPHVTEYPNNGLFGKLILGHSPGGVEIYVPSTMYEDAANILKAKVEDIDDSLNDEEV
jgi:hypothetical protein